MTPVGDDPASPLAQSTRPDLERWNKRSTAQDNLLATEPMTLAAPWHLPKPGRRAFIVSKPV